MAEEQRIIETVNGEIHLALLDYGEPIPDGCHSEPLILLTECGLSVPLKDVHNFDEIELTCKKCVEINMRNKQS